MGSQKGAGHKQRARELRQKRARAKALRRKIGWTAVVLAVAAPVVLFLVQSGGGGATAAGDASVGQRVPRMEMAGFNGGEVVVPNDYRGKPVVMNFWASWCPFCIAEMPDFEKVHQDVGEEVAFLGVNLRDRRDAADDLVDETAVTYEMSVDPNGDIYTAFGGTSMPTTVFIDAQGRMVELVSGQIQEGQLRDMLTEFFGVDASA